MEGKMKTKNESCSKKFTLSLLLAKLVRCMKIEESDPTDLEELGAAILGSRSHKFYELILYRGSHEYISTIKIDEEFTFNVQSEDTAWIMNEHKAKLELKFTSGEDLREFAIHIGLARWIVSDMQSVLSQDVMVMKPDEEEDEKKPEHPVSEHGDYIEMYYVAKVITKEFKFGMEVANNTKDGRPLVLKIGTNSTEWDAGLVGAAPGSKRLLIIPHQSLAIWKCLVPNWQHLSLLVTIQRFGRSESDFNIWKPILDSVPSDFSTSHSRACRPGVLAQLFKNGRSPSIRGCMSHMLSNQVPSFHVDPRISIQPYNLLQLSASNVMKDNLTVALFETLTQMKICNSKVKEQCSLLEMKNSLVKVKIVKLLRTNLKIIHELEENLMEINEMRNQDEVYMNHPGAITVENNEENEQEITYGNRNIELAHPFGSVKSEVKVFTCESILPELEQLSNLKL